MAVPTVDVTVRCSEQDGDPISGAIITARMSGNDRYQGQFVARIVQEVVADVNGVAILELFPNVLGEVGTMYVIKGVHPTTGRLIFKYAVTVPNVDSNLEDLVSSQTDAVPFSGVQSTSISGTGQANDLVGVRADLTSLEYKRLIQGGGISITYAPGSITIAAASPPPFNKVVAAAITNTSLVGLSTVDGVVLVEGDFVLLTNQTAPAENGLYAASEFGWVRADAAASWDAITGQLVYVVGGTKGAGRYYRNTNAYGGTLDSTAIGFEQLMYENSGRIGMGAGSLAAITSGGRNIAVGTNALAAALSETDMVAIGDNAAASARSNGSVFIGSDAGRFDIGGFVVAEASVGIGYHALRGVNGVSNFNNDIAIGAFALAALSTGTSNVAVGGSNLQNLTTGSGNTAVGAGASANMPVGGAINIVSLGFNAGRDSSNSNCIFIGSSAGINQKFSGASNNVFVGTQAGSGDGSSATGINNIGIGSQTLIVMTSAEKNVMIGTAAGDLITTGSRNIGIGMNALGGATTTNDAVAIGNDAMLGYTGARGVAIGASALTTTAGNDAVAVGYNAMVNVTSGQQSVAIGSFAMGGGSGGGGCVAIGYNALFDNTASDNIGIGDQANSGVTNGQRNIGIGTAALSLTGAGGVRTGADNIGIGWSAGRDTSSDIARVVSIGTEAGRFQKKSGNANSVFIGYQAGYGDSSGSTTTGSNNTGIGSQALFVATTASDCVAIGTAAADALTTGSRIVGVGVDAMGVLTTGSDMVGVGYKAGSDTAAATAKGVFVGTEAGRYQKVGGDTDSVFLGYRAGMGDSGGTTTGSKNIGVGSSALAGITTGTDNVAVGHAAADVLTTGTHIVSIGTDAAGLVTTGADLVGIGYKAGGDTHTATSKGVFVGTEAGRYQKNTTNVDSVYVGYRAGLGNAGGTTTASKNVGIGSTALTVVTTGTDNVAIGNAAADALTTGVGNIAIGTDALGGIAAPTGAIAIGHQANDSAAAGDRSIAVGNEVDAEAAQALATGYQSRALQIGQWKHAVGQFSAQGDCQTGLAVLRRVTTDGTANVVLTADAAAPGSTNQVVLPNDSTFVFDVLLTARRTDADNESAGYRLTGVIDRNTNAASTALVGTVTKVVLAEDTAAWDVDAVANTTNGCLEIRVTGEAAKNIRWAAFVRTTEVTG